MTTRDRWARRGDRAGEGDVPVAELVRQKPWRGASRYADEFRVFAAANRMEAEFELTRAITGNAAGHWFGIPAARRALHVAAMDSTIAAALDLCAVGAQ